MGEIPGRRDVAVVRDTSGGRQLRQVSARACSTRPRRPRSVLRLLSVGWWRSAAASGRRVVSAAPPRARGRGGPRGSADRSSSRVEPGGGQHGRDSLRCWQQTGQPITAICTGDRGRVSRSGQVSSAFRATRAPRAARVPRRYRPCCGVSVRIRRPIRQRLLTVAILECSRGAVRGGAYRAIRPATPSGWSGRRRRGEEVARLVAVGSEAMRIRRRCRARGG